ncbi:RNA-directed DNA polymerase from mobile element jockey-like [Brachionus plicatilis]|uniref:RNA-directed DNA polymerase from mobile element jockey-like n=1 Tax=Brachionus plicatilis TaxID=10195 RepID=A0A3M7SBQ8_BRAPC|nr:RNA-directed DNA polymerase from mobile element jockey-like [Brachionus plicatilis]
MSVPKCNCIVFSRTSKGNNSLNLFMNNQQIPQAKEVNFLGCILDQNLNFNHQIERIKEKCAQRLNIIKILSYKSWKLKKKTLIGIFRSLIGSIIDYSFFVLSTISKASISKIQAIQNRAIRSIYDLHFDPIKRTCPSIIDAKAKSGLSDVCIRIYEINIRYICKTITNNQLIQQLVYEYIECTSSIRREGSKKTPLCILSPITSMFLKSDLNLKSKTMFSLIFFNISLLSLLIEEKNGYFKS